MSEPSLNNIHENTIHGFVATSVTGQLVNFSDYEGKVILIVNTASKCIFTSQYRELKELYTKYKPQGLEIFVFPCNQFMFQEEGQAEDIMEFCRIYYDIDFQVMKKVHVNGKLAHPLYQWLKLQKHGVFNDKIKWNFSKFLINQEGKVVDRYAPFTRPEKLIPDIEALLTKQPVT